MVFVVHYCLGEVGTVVQIIESCVAIVLLTIKREKYCKHSKGLEELAIEGASWKHIDNSIIQMKI